MKRKWYLAVLPAVILAGWAAAQPAADPLIEGFRKTEVASVADATEQLYGQRSYMAHDMRPLFKTKFAGPAYTVLLREGGEQGRFCGYPRHAGRD